ncbi:MAG TPA: DMT family transporter [Solirubrobacteraceae bacterium]|jgi:drug/metabolite transporter (DMT)-like permease|nr:DMT family transporter [Solirubrobacteraceae bacterium]
MIVFGILIAFAASVANAFALVLQAQEARGTSEKRAARFSLLWGLAKRPRWLLGTALLALGLPLQILSLSFAPLTVVQPVLATFQLILVAISRFYLRERVDWSEWVGALAVTAGVALVIVAAPHRTVTQPAPGRVAVPLALVGIAALVAFAIGRRQPVRGLVLALGAGFGYAWVDFTDKLVSNALSDGKLLIALIWLLAILGFGAIAFLEENTALQRRPAVQVAPVIGAIQEPLPVLMALAGGVEAWAGGIARLAGLAGGLALAGLGASILAHSPAASRVGTADG